MDNTLTITKPRELAAVVKANISLHFLLIAEGQLFMHTRGGRLIIDFDVTPERYKAVKAYVDALSYELQMIVVYPVVFIN